MCPSTVLLSCFMCFYFTSIRSISNTVLWLCQSIGQKFKKVTHDECQIICHLETNSSLFQLHIIKTYILSMLLCIPLKLSVKNKMKHVNNISKWILGNSFRHRILSTVASSASSHLMSTVCKPFFNIWRYILCDLPRLHFPSNGSHLIAFFGYRCSSKWRI